MTDLTTLTPQQIDQALYDLYLEVALAKARYDQAWDSVHHYVHEILGLSWQVKVTAQQVQDVCQETSEMVDAGESLPMRYDSLWKTVQRAEGFAAQEENAILAQQPYDEEFDRRGGWTRAFLVTNTGGHVHKTMRCSTCFASTSFQWLPDLSDHDEAEIIEKAGVRACTVCYPDAPVEALSRPTQIFSTEEISKKERAAQREQAKKDREAKRLDKALLPSGEPLKVFTGMGPGHFTNPDGSQGWARDARETYETFTTLVSARKWLTDQAQYVEWAWSVAPQEARDQVIAAVAAKEAKTSEQVWDEAKTRAKKRK